jgi:hypothetical protein
MKKPPFGGFGSLADNVYLVKPARPPREEVIKKFLTDIEIAFIIVIIL